MKELLKIFFALFFICLITFSTINVFAADTVISNQTNSTNSTNTTKIVTKNAVVQPMSLSVSVSVTPESVDFGNLTANGGENTYANAAIVQVRAFNFIFGGGGTLSVRADSAFTMINDNSKTIALNNFKYDCPTVSLGKTAFTTTDSEIAQYSPPFIGTVRKTYYLNYYLTIPYGTDPGNYTTTVYYTAT